MYFYIKEKIYNYIIKKNENNLFLNNIVMNRFQNYARAKILADDLGIPRTTITGYWRNNQTNQYWRTKVKTYGKEITKRNRLHIKAVALAQNLRLPAPRAVAGTRHKFWKNALQRMRMKRLRATRRGRAQARARMAQILPRVRQAPVRRRARFLLPQLRQEVERRQTQARINRRIRNSQFQQILNAVVNNGETLSEAQIQRFWTKVIQRGRFTLRVRFDDGHVRHIAFNEASRDFINHILTNGLVMWEEAIFGSDTINTFDFQHIRELEIIRYEAPPRAIRNADGAFFPYFNTSEIDLLEYQIYPEDIKYNDDFNKNNREQCLIYTLLKANIKREVVNQIKLSYVNGASISKKDLHNIANIIKRNINLYTRTQGEQNGRTQKQRIKSNDPQGDDINIALYEYHYFLYETTKYSSYSIENYEKIKHIEGWHNIIKSKKKKGRKTKYIKKNNSKINSLLLVHKMKEAGYFKKLDMSIFEESASHRELRNHIYLGNIENEQQDVSMGKKNADGSITLYRNERRKKVINSRKDLPRKDLQVNTFNNDERQLTEEGKSEDLQNIFSDDEEEEEEDLNVREVFYADCEAFTGGINHELYLLGVVGSNDDIVNIYNVCDQEEKKEVSAEQRVVYKFLNRVSNNKKKPALVYFHNLKYDYHILEKYLSIKKRCEKDGQLYNVICKFGTVEIELRDSYKIIPFALKDFGKEFDLPKKIRKKEAIAYHYYTRENNNKRIKTNFYKSLLCKEDRFIFESVVRGEYCEYDSYDKTFNPLEYYKEYLRLDCLVLKKGIEKFNELIMNITDGMSIYDNLTISSLTDKYMKIEGAYDGVKEVCGNLREYIAGAVYGGRVCVNKKYEKKVIEGKISDYDGVSLYPSAINRLCREIGLPTGMAKRFIKPPSLIDGVNSRQPDWGEDYIPDLDDLENLTVEQTGDLHTWEDKIYSILTVKITAVNKIQQMPFIAHKNDTSIKYTNEPPKEPIIIDSTTLQDYIEFHDIDYEILDGVYWDDGVNKKMGEIIQRLFNARLEAKKQKKKALSNVIKLMLNSSYGKTIMKKAKSMKKIVNIRTKRYCKKTKKWSYHTKTKWENFVYRNFNTIKSWRKLNENCYEVEMICADNSYNRGHIGCAILSMSKRIMNEVFDIANDFNLPIYYTDTDSLHCNLEDVAKLEEKYEEKYEKKLNGKELEQFHTDFDLEGACSEIYATKSIFLGKKSYIDCLESKDKDGNIIKGHHIRLKGITKEGLEHEAKKYDNSYFGLYEELAEGKTKKIILNPYNEEQNKTKVLFEFKNGNVSTRKEFIREVKF